MSPNTPIGAIKLDQEKGDSEAKTRAGLNVRAKVFALQNTVELGNLAPPTVSFESIGKILVAGPFAAVQSFADEAVLANDDQANGLSNEFTLLATDIQPVLPEVHRREVKTYFSQEVSIDGFMGAFEVTVVRDGARENFAKVTTGADTFDLIIDLTEEGLHAAQVPPLGYYAVGRGLYTPEQVIELLPDMKGTFDKPKFFRLDNEGCAFTSRGLKGCTRCLDACPADALSVVDNAVTINPYLCQGMGTCATACPTEAISYALPDPQSIQSFVFNLLANYRKEGGLTPVILFHDKESRELALSQLTLGESHVIPVALEELGSVGIDTWFAALAYGAHQVLLATTSTIPEKVSSVLHQELVIAQRFLSELGYTPERISMVELEQQASLEFFADPLAKANEPLTGNKREKLSAALDALWQASVVKPDHSPVPEGAPYGRINLDAEGCTLCMGCVTVCPTGALTALGTQPGLAFSESPCVQCGLCEQSCPENVLSLTPTFTWDSEKRNGRFTLFEEAAAECVSCGKPFAPASMINMLIEKLQNHSHFQDDAIRRLSMCEDCRVRDIVADIADNPSKQTGL